MIRTIAMVASYIAGVVVAVLLMCVWLSRSWGRWNRGE